MKKTDTECNRAVVRITTVIAKKNLCSTRCAYFYDWAKGKADCELFHAPLFLAGKSKTKFERLNDCIEGEAVWKRYKLIKG